MKKIFYRIYSALFIGICLIPAVLTPFVKADESKEKRKLEEFPAIKTEEGKLNFEFFSEFDKYFSEHFAFRQQLVTADGRLRSAVSGTSANSDVIVGKDGWLFYGETVNDFLRTDTLDGCEINNIAHDLRLIDERCREVGAKFIFFSAPNKNTIYPEYMPFNYVPADRESNYEKLSAKLCEDDFYFDMKAALTGLDSPTALYHKTDTHWNNFGAYAAHTMLMNELGKAPCGTGNGWYVAHDRSGDLAEMLYPAEGAKDMQLHNDYEPEYEYTSHFRGLDDISITTSCKNGEGRLVMFRDSYGEAILPYMAECFSEAEFLRAVPYRLGNLKSGDTLIIELVERNIGNLQKYAPVMSAPIRDISDISPELYDGAKPELLQEESYGLTHISGILPEECFTGEDHKIFVKTGGAAYEAFNCYEAALEEIEQKRTPYGFSIYIPTENVGGQMDIIILENDGNSRIISY